MTNYNERLDEVLQNLSWKQHELGTKGLIPLSRHEYEAKQSITCIFISCLEKKTMGLCYLGQTSQPPTNLLKLIKENTNDT